LVSSCASSASCRAAYIAHLGVCLRHRQLVHRPGGINEIEVLVDRSRQPDIGRDNFDDLRYNGRAARLKNGD
jgi:hypothetical protein